MGKIVCNAVCEKMIWDSANCKLYYPGDVDDIELDNPVALSFKLSIDDRKYTRGIVEEMAQKIEKDKKEAKKMGFSLKDYREYKKQVDEENEAMLTQTGKEQAVQA